MLALVLAVAASAPTLREGVTYCVGGYDIQGFNHVDACQLPAQAGRHSAWHFHAFLTDGTACYACWDEEDSTCETVFVAENKGWRSLFPFESLCAGHPASDSVLHHVVDGQDVGTPPPRVTSLTAALDALTPGAHAAGDRMAVSGAIRDTRGAIRPVTGGNFVVTTDDGRTFTFTGVPRADGSIAGDIELPAAERVDVTFVPDRPTLAPGETLVSAASGPASLAVDPCRYRARVTAPAVGASLASGAPVALRAALYENATPVAAIPGTSLTFGLTGGASLALPADPSLAATWTPPPSPTPSHTSITASGTAGGFAVCPAPGVDITWSDLGIGFDTTGLPTRCYAGMDCRGDIRLVRPDGGAARQRVDALLTAAGAEAILTDNGEEVWRGAPRVDDIYPYSQVLTDLAAHALVLTIRGSDGTPVVMPGHTLLVRPPLKVVVPAVLDFGTHAAGDEWTTTCARLDMSASQAAQEHVWELRVDGVDGCQARPGIGHANAAGHAELVSLLGPVTQPAFDPAHPEFTICLELPDCAADNAPAAAALHLRPLTKEFADQARDIPLRWVVTGRPWYLCHGWWMGPSGLALIATGLLIGVLRPARFPAGAAIRVAGSDAGLKRSSALLLRGCPGARPGLYRDACLGVHGDGTVDGRVRGTPVQVRATRDRGVVLQGAGPLDVLSAGGKWSPVEGLARGVLPSPRATYRAGSTLFKVDPG